MPEAQVTQWGPTNSSLIVSDTRIRHKAEEVLQHLKCRFEPVLTVKVVFAR